MHLNITNASINGELRAETDKEMDKKERNGAKEEIICDELQEYWWIIVHWALAHYRSWTTFMGI